MDATAESGSGMSSGALLFGRYAFPPNRLGYCGPNDSQALLEYVSERRTDQGLVELERRFEGAYPYLKLIALANGIADPLDRRVVEAYWIGNACLEKVDPASFYDSLEERFKPRMGPSTFVWMIGKLELGAKPHHNFHVFDVYVRAGLMNDARAAIAVETMDSCRISWGKVVSTDGAELVVDRAPLVLRGGKLVLGEPEVKRVMRQIDGRGFADDVQPGEFVSIHWNWTCEVLSVSALRRLQQSTRRAIALANTTM
jgi:hypothetical protein